MNSAELIARVRRRVFMTLGTHPDFDDLTILQELNDTMTTLFERAIVEARSGYWQQTQDVAVTANRASYRLPARACGFEKLELGIGSPAQFFPIELATEAHAALFERRRDQLGMPEKYVVRGDQIVLLPTPDNTSYTIRIYYYLRPSRLVLPQSTGLAGVGGTVRGQITNVVNNVLTVNTLPFDQELSSPAAIQSSTLDPVDIIHPDGWHELAVVGAIQSNNGSTTITLPTGTDTTNVGFSGINRDFVRKAEQTDWPQLPDDFHVCLADAAAVRIMTTLNMAAKAAQVASSVSADLTRFQSLIAPRVKAAPPTIRAPLPYLRGSFTR